MKKILFALCVVLALVGCKKSETTEGGSGGGTTGTFKFNNGENGVLTLSVGGIETISLDGAEPTDCNFTSSNDAVAIVQGIKINALSEGTVTITATLKADNSKTATLQVNVVDALKNIKWDQVMYMQASEEWQDKSYYLYRTRSYRGDELASDSALTRIDTHTGDTADIQSWVGNLTEADFNGKWYYLYTNENGKDIGVFRDSIITCRLWLMSTDAYFDGEGSFAISGDNAPVMDFTDYCKHDGTYIFVLGDRTFTDDPSTVEAEQFTVQGGEPAYYPGYVQIGHFDTASYMGMWREYWETGEMSEDYDYFQDRDSKINMYYNYYDEESGESGVYGWVCGYPVAGTDAQGCNLYIASDTREGNYWCKAQYYYFTAKMFTNWDSYGLGYTYNEDDGNYYYTGEMGPIQEVTYSGGEYPSSKPGKHGVRRNNSHEMQPMLASAFRKQVSVNSTIGATLRMIMGTRK